MGCSQPEAHPVLERADLVTLQRFTPKAIDERNYIPDTAFD
jgi:hypothetical protein